MKNSGARYKIRGTKAKIAIYKIFLNLVNGRQFLKKIIKPEIVTHKAIVGIQPILIISCVFISNTVANDLTSNV
jgi:hypothetical protein